MENNNEFNICNNSFGNEFYGDVYLFDYILFIQENKDENILDIAFIGNQDCKIYFFIIQ